MKLNSCVNYEALHDRICIIHNRCDFILNPPYSKSCTYVVRNRLPANLRIFNPIKISGTLYHKEKRNKSYGKLEAMRLLTTALKHLYLMQENSHTFKGKNPRLTSSFISQIQ